LRLDLPRLHLGLARGCVMAIVDVVDQTDDNTGTAVTEDMFGLNALFTVTAPDDAQLFDRYEDLGVTNLRYPGGSVTEWYFDISDIGGDSHERSSGTFQGNTQSLTPFTDFVDLAANLGTDVTLVVPTINGFTQSAGEALLTGTYGERVIDADHLAHVAEFVEAAVATAQAQGTRGMRFPPMQEETAAALPGPLAHREVADALHPVLARLLQGRAPPGAQ